MQRGKEGYPSAKMGRSGLAQGQGVHREMKSEGFESVLANFLPEVVIPVNYPSIQAKSNQ